MSQKTLVGAAETVITPPVGTELAGYFHPRVSEGVISTLALRQMIADANFRHCQKLWERKQQG